MFAWLIEGIKPNKRKRADDEIFELFDNHFKLYGASTEIYQSSLYNKFKKRGVFGDIVVDSMRKTSELSNARSIYEFVEENSRIIRVNSIEMRKIFLECWKETMDELGSETKKLVMHGFKLDIERTMRKSALDLETFEKMQFQFRDRYDKVVVVGMCGSCHGVFTGNCDLLEYMEAYNYSGGHNVLTNCKRCQTGIILEKVS